MESLSLKHLCWFYESSIFLSPVQTKLGKHYTHNPQIVFFAVNIESHDVFVRNKGRVWS